MSVKIDQEYELVPLQGDEDVIKPHPQNPNKGDDAIVLESIDENGWYGVITVQKSTGYILAGHTRWRVLVAKKAEFAPVVWRDVDDQTALKIMLADNQTAKHAEMDEALLEELLQGLDTLDGTGFVLASAQEQITKEPDEAPAADGEDGDAEIPDDDYTPEFGIMIVCDTAVQQKTRYEWLKRNAPDWDVKVVAV